MRRSKQKSLLRLILKEQATSVIYFIAVFVVYLILFYFASLSLLLETLKYLWPAIVVGGGVILLNLFRTWRRVSNR